jgi:tRNA G18 (ribose-2'-O)-methylase SpoU
VELAAIERLHRPRWYNDEAMHSMEAIHSRENPLVKRYAAALAGREAGVLALEGERLVRDALQAEVELECVLLAASRAAEAASFAPCPVRLVDDALLARLSELEAPPGVAALARQPAQVELEDLPRGARSLLVCVAGVSDPGNLGAIARSAEAFGACGLVVAKGGASPWRGKALRGSMGSLLRLPVRDRVEPAAAAQELVRLGWRLVVAATRGGVDPRELDWRGPVALWLSGETGELPDLGAPSRATTIPLDSRVESLNVAVAAAVLVFAARRTGAEGARDG